MSLANDVLKDVRGLATDAVWRRMIQHNGRLRSSRWLPARLKDAFANRWAIEERSNIALTVASMYSGGDYFEFGSESFTTLMNFLTAFDLNSRNTGALKDTRFFAFDVFGDIDTGAGVPQQDRWYYEQYRGDARYKEDERRLRRHNPFADRCELVKGYFEDTLNEQFKERLRRERRSVGFAFLDCNIAPSYQTCFDFLVEFMRPDRSFVYMDEYFLTLEVPPMFADFCDKVRERHGLAARYLRNAGAFGALFILMQEGRIASPEISG
jgi:hypothetical protein